ncbi:hypothetical protein [Streptomyces sp. NPDC000618]|uniref:hypothetical protein n=1 Tax=Streptomyces sp. NPDC000618 TaxID=3154265 RepID=UPI00332EC755
MRPWHPAHDVAQRRQRHPALRLAVPQSDLDDPHDRLDRGGRFPAMEEPDLLVGDVRAFFRQLREKG